MVCFDTIFLNKKMVRKLKAYILMVFVQFAYAAVNIIYKLAINDGMSMRVVTAYRLLFASLFTVPVALIYDRNNSSKITSKVLFLGFLCGLFGGSLFSNLYLVAMDLTSASFMLAMINLTPGITFIMALSCGYRFYKFGLHPKADILDND
ncbi:hypothetical protein V8G54_002901 [Vigna mungo]|uniref:WAT1-related protein n=1 Tax=Vigna mungo TaxID=3915 RepID=A0AAQ3PB54_VIGMU